MKTIYTEPRFEPTQDGFSFNNTFENTILPGDAVNGLISNFPGFLRNIINWISGGNHLKTSGRCGGMTYAALDYFVSDQKVPRDTHVQPGPNPLPDGDVIADYILERQYDSFHHIADEFLVNHLIPGQGTHFYQHCLPPYGLNFLFYIANIDNGRPMPLALLPKGNIIGHQVLGIGYTNASDPKDVLIHVYDPNYHDQECVLKLDQAERCWRLYRYDSVKGEVGNSKNRSWFSWNAAAGYEPEEPGIFHPEEVKRDYRNRDLKNFRVPQNENLRGFLFSNSDFSGHKNLDSCDFQGAWCTNTNFSQCVLRGSSFLNSKLRSANFSNADLRSCTFIEAKLQGTVFNNTDLSNVVFRNISRLQADPLIHFANAQLNNTHFTHSHLQAFFAGANIDKSNFIESNLEGSYFHCLVTSSKFMKSNLARVRFSRGQMADVRFIACDLRDASFSGSVLKNISFVSWITNTGKSESREYCRLDGADFRNAVIHGLTIEIPLGADQNSWRSSRWHGASIRTPISVPPALLAHIISQGATLR